MLALSITANSIGQKCDLYFILDTGHIIWAVIGKYNYECTTFFTASIQRPGSTSESVSYLGLISPTAAVISVAIHKITYTPVPHSPGS